MRRVLLAGLVIAFAVALLSPFASSHPDGLERVAEDQGFLDRAREAPYKLLPDYTIPGVTNEPVSTILAGFVGVALVAGSTIVFAKFLSRGRADEVDSSHADLQRQD